MQDLDDNFITSVRGLSPSLLLRSELTACPLPQFKINTLGVIHSITAFLPLLRTGSAKKIVVINTGGADVKTVHKQGAMGLAAYSITKCAALMATTKWAAKLQSEGFIVTSLTPGLVDTTGTMGEHGEYSFDYFRHPTDGLWSGTQAIPLRRLFLWRLRRALLSRASRLYSRRLSSLS